MRAELGNVKEVVSVNGRTEAGSWHLLMSMVHHDGSVARSASLHKPDSIHSSPEPHSTRTELSLPELSSDLHLCTVAHEPYTLSHTSYTHSNNAFKSKLSPEKNSSY